MLARHPLPLLTQAVPPVVLCPEGTMLVLQDLHAPFADPVNGRLAQRARAKVLTREFDEYFQTLALVTSNIQQILSKARQLQIRVAFSCLGYFSPGAPSPFQRATDWRWDLCGPDGQFPSAWTPEKGERLFAKPGWSALMNPDFAQFLQDETIRSVILIGTMFEFGIRHTCLDLADRGIGCLVVSDAVVALTEAGERQACGELAHGLTKLRSTGELLELLEELRTEESVLV